MESVILLFFSILLFALIARYTRKVLRSRIYEIHTGSFSRTASRLAHSYKVFSLITLEAILLYFMVVSVWGVFRLEPLVALN